MQIEPIVYMYLATPPLTHWTTPLNACVSAIFWYSLLTAWLQLEQPFSNPLFLVASLSTTGDRVSNSRTFELGPISTCLPWSQLASYPAFPSPRFLLVVVWKIGGESLDMVLIWCVPRHMFELVLCSGRSFPVPSLSTGPVLLPLWPSLYAIVP